jgi:hypothetical protein
MVSLFHQLKSSPSAWVGVGCCRDHPNGFEIGEYLPEPARQREGEALDQFAQAHPLGLTQTKDEGLLKPFLIRQSFDIHPSLTMGLYGLEVGLGCLEV